MSFTGILDMIPIWGVFILLVLFTFLPTAIGAREGRRRQSRSTSKEPYKAGAFTASALGLLSFLLAIIYGIVSNRVQDLKQVALDEASAIGTTYLQADLLPEADRAEVRHLLRDYVVLRIESGADGTSEALAEAVELQDVLWAKAVILAEQQPTPISALFIDSVGDLIDLQEKMVTVNLRYRLPGMVWPVLFGLAVLVMAMAGYSQGLSEGGWSIPVLLGAAVAYSIVLVLVISLDRPSHNMDAGQPAMLDVQASMQE